MFASSNVFYILKIKEGIILPSLFLRTGRFFGEKFSNCMFLQKVVESKINEWYHQKVLLKSFPMNGHVSRFRQFLCAALGVRSRHQS
jgi:hypothetical protein